MSEIDAAKLISPHGFDGNGPIPDEIRAAAKRIAKLRTKYLLQGALAVQEIGDLFDAAALQAEWMRELYEAVQMSARTSD